jgi:hypothetical protein
MDVSLLQESGEDRAQISSRPPVEIALAPAAAAARAALASNSHGEKIPSLLLLHKIFVYFTSCRSVTCFKRLSQIVTL